MQIFGEQRGLGYKYLWVLWQVKMDGSSREQPPRLCRMRLQVMSTRWAFSSECIWTWTFAISSLFLYRSKGEYRHQPANVHTTNWLLRRRGRFYATLLVKDKLQIVCSMRSLKEKTAFTDDNLNTCGFNVLFWLSDRHGGDYYFPENQIFVLVNSKRCQTCHWVFSFDVYLLTTYHIHDPQQTYSSVHAVNGFKWFHWEIHKYKGVSRLSGTSNRMYVHADDAIPVGPFGSVTVLTRCQTSCQDQRSVVIDCAWARWACSYPTQKFQLLQNKNKRQHLLKFFPWKILCVPNNSRLRPCRMQHRTRSTSNRTQNKMRPWVIQCPSKNSWRQTDAIDQAREGWMTTQHTVQV